MRVLDFKWPPAHKAWCVFHVHHGELCFLTAPALGLADLYPNTTRSHKLAESSTS